MTSVVSDITAWVLCLASLATALLSRKAVQRSERSRRQAILELSRCSGCGGPHAGFIHNPDCPGPGLNQTR